MSEVKMNSALGDLPVTRVETDFSATAKDTTVFYRPKNTVGPTSMQQRIVLPYVQDGAVMNHGRMATTVSANKVDRERSYNQLKRMSTAGNADAATMLKALSTLLQTR